MNLQNRGNLKNRGHARRKDRRGASLVEFAILVPILVMLVLGVIDVGQLIHVGQTVNNASREGARVAVKQQTTNPAVVEAEVRDYLAGVFPGDPTDAAVKVSVSGNGGTALSDVEPGEPVTVRVAMDFDTVRWIRGLSLTAGRTITTETVMRKE